jgi:hypothetical protein
MEIMGLAEQSPKSTAKERDKVLLKMLKTRPEPQRGNSGRKRQSSGAKKTPPNRTKQN